MPFDIKKTTKQAPFIAFDKPDSLSEKTVLSAAKIQPQKDWSQFKNLLSALSDRAQGLLLLIIVVLPFAFALFFYQIAQNVWLALVAGFIWLVIGQSAFLAGEWRLPSARLPRIWSASLFLLATYLFLGKALSNVGISPLPAGGLGGEGVAAPGNLAILASIIVLLLLCFKNYSREKIKFFIAVYFILVSVFAIFFLFFPGKAMSESGLWLVFIINFILLFALSWSREGGAKLFWAASALLHLFVILRWWSIREQGVAFWTLWIWACLASAAGIYLSWPAFAPQDGATAGKPESDAIIIKTNGPIGRQLSLLVFLVATAFLVYSIISL